MTDKKVANLFKLDQLKFVVLPGADPDPAFTEYYNSAYKCWLRTWEEAYKELGQTKYLHSDDFTRQTEIDCVFYGSTCVALLFLRWADFRNNATKNDSYFKLWTDKEFDQLTQYGPEVIIISNTTVAKEWRGKNAQFPMKDLVLYLTIQRFLSSTSPTMTAVTRNARGVNKLIERFGAVMFKEGVPNFNENDLVNLGAFFRKDMTEGTDPTVKDVGRSLIKKMIVVPRIKTVISEPQKIHKKAA